MATPDFNKIWATNSPLTKYEFTDENYLTGWNFIGSIPPARSMFDTLQKSTDEKLKWLFDESATQKDITVDDNSAPTSNTAKLLALINNLANMEKQIKGDGDWKTAPSTNLATLATLVSNLASGSDVTWSGKKFTNAKLGITGLIDRNGYISFGPNFGGLIIQWGIQLVALNGMAQSFALPLTISYAMAAVMTMRSGDFSGFVACPYWTECTTDTIMITPDYETQQGYTGTGKSNVTWILLAI
jgi:hypothetical protein